jgi:hypothetical protein
MIEGNLISPTSVLNCFASREKMKLYLMNKSVYLGAHVGDIRNEAYTIMGESLLGSVHVHPNEPAILLKEHIDCYEILVREKCCYIEKVYQWLPFPIPKAGE